MNRFSVVDARRRVLEQIPILDAYVARPNRDDPTAVVLELAHPCPFCGYKHTHGDDINIKLGMITHRLAHCPDYDRRGRKVPRPAYGYWLRIVEAP